MSVVASVVIRLVAGFVASFLLWKAWPRTPEIRQEPES